MYLEFTLKCDNLALIRGERLLFKQAGFELTNRQVLHIQGANGTGKTSLLRVLCGIIEADEGELHWQQQPIEQTRQDFYLNTIYLGHQLGVKKAMTVEENLAFYQAMRPQSLSVSISDAIAQVGLAGFEQQWVANLSQGQKRRVSLARLLLESAPLWILDEPFVALDVKGQSWLAQHFEAHRERGGSIIFTSHQPVELACDVQKLVIGAQ